jgi:glutaredoxin-like protein
MATADYVETTLSAPLRRGIEAAMAKLTAPVGLALFTHPAADEITEENTEDMRRLLEEVAALSQGRVSLATYDVLKDEGIARSFGIDKTPALVVLGGDARRDPYGIRFYGFVSGYEFGTLIEDLKMVSSGVPPLAEATRAALSRLKEPVHIQVFVTPTCPYCPGAVLLAHRFALASDRVKADMIDASEFPDLANRYGVYAVPRIVINDRMHVEGAVPEGVLLSQLESLMGEGAGALP